jgi:hypothetical protein
MSNNLNLKNDCKYFDQKFIDYLNGILPEKDAEFCRQHLNSCPECKSNEMYSEMLFTWKQLEKWPDIQPSKNFMAKLQHEIVRLEEKRRVLWFKIDNFFIFARVPIMAVILIMVTFTTNFSYAAAGHMFDIKKSAPVIANKIKVVKEIKVIDVLENISKVYKNSKEKRK